MERRGDSISKITFGITKEETKKFVLGITFLTFFKNNNLIKQLYSKILLYTL